MRLEQVTEMVIELSQRIAGSRVDKIHQPAADLLLFRLWNGRENLRLRISASAQESSIGLTDDVYPNPFTPPRFCQLLRARLSRIVKVAQLNDDRIVELTCQGPKGDCRLIVELFDRGGNLILVDAEGKIIDILKRQQDGRLALKAIYHLPEKRTTNETFKEICSSGAVASKRDPGNSTDLSGRLNKLLKKEKKKLERRIRNILQEQERQQNFEQYRMQGDLLLSSLRLLKKGMTEVAVLDYYQQPSREVVIPLDPLLNPQENVEKVYNKYKKAKRGLEHSSRRLEETSREIEWLEQLGYQLDSAEEPSDIAEVADELRIAGLLKDKIGKLPRTQKGGSSFKQALSPSGFKVLWGTSSKQNDTLSTQKLKRGDLWFHAHRCPGSHVLLKADRGLGEFADADLGFAASIAAVNSKVGKDSKVEVMVAEAKDVKKPSGAKPGMVTVARYKTLVVQPFDEKTDVF